MGEAWSNRRITVRLAPCPFCSNPAALAGPPWRVTCTTCGATGPESRTVDHARRLWGTRAAPEVSGERAAVVAFLLASAEAKREHAARQDTRSQRRISAGQERLLRALARDIAAGLHLTSPEP